LYRKKKGFSAIESALHSFCVADTMEGMMRSTDNIPSSPHAELQRVLIPRDHIARRVRELADELIVAYEEKELTIVFVLTGALTFTADLIRLLPIRLRIEPVSVSSYTGTSTRPHQATFRLPLPENLQGRDVLIVDDIFDSGQTMAILVAAVRAAGARDVKRCALLRKARPDLPDQDDGLDFYGFDIPDEFVVGYGLDYNGYFRNLPDVSVLRISSEKTGKTQEGAT
jgi:hypoxanthine phosphoribosyltransferase